MLTVCEAMTEWAMCEAELWSIRSFSDAQSFRFEALLALGIYLSPS